MRIMLTTDWLTSLKTEPCWAPSAEQSEQLKQDDEGVSDCTTPGESLKTEFYSSEHDIII